MEQGNSKRWCILRMASGSTLTVVEALRETGFEVWTPVETIKRRIGRRRDVKESQLPLTPGIAFANDDRVSDLAALARAPALTYQRYNRETERMETRGCPYFSIFRYQGKFARVADRSLDALRQAEQRVRPRAAKRIYAAGDKVRLPDGAWEGLTGSVVGASGARVVVLFDGHRIPVAIETDSLLPAQRAA